MKKSFVIITLLLSFSFLTPTKTEAFSLSSIPQNIGNFVSGFLKPWFGGTPPNPPLDQGREENNSPSNSAKAPLDKPISSPSPLIIQSAGLSKEEVQKMISGSIGTLTLPNSLSQQEGRQPVVNNYYTNGGSGSTQGLANALGRTATNLQSNIDNLSSSMSSILTTPSITGEASFSSSLFLSQISAPSDTTNRLYNTSGNLYWAGNLIGGASTGNWTLSGSDVYRTSGKIGVGTTSPFAQLSVNSIAGQPAFVVGSSTATSFIVDKNGNVGIGTTTPSASLFVNNNTDHVALKLQATSGQSSNLQEWLRSDGNPVAYVTSNGKFVNYDPDKNYQFSMDASYWEGPRLALGNNYADDAYFSIGAWDGRNNFNTQNRDLRFYSSTNDLMYLSATTGKVGIGTTSPGSLLSIGNTGGINFSLATSTFSTSGGVNLTSGCYAVNGTCVGGGGSQWTTTGSNIYYNSGNVGIGTAAPNYALEIAGDLTAVNPKAGYLSVDNTLLSNLEGGVYYGRVGVKENQWGLNNYGTTWTQTSSPSLRWEAIAMSSDGKIQTGVSFNGYIYTSTNYGATWTQDGNTSSVWDSVAMSSDGKIQTAVASVGYIYTSTNYGATWTQRGSSKSWNFVAMSSDGKIQTAVDNNNGYIWISTNYGVTWTQENSSPQQYWTSIAMSSDGKIQTATAKSNGYVYTSTNYGATWTQNSNFLGPGCWQAVAMSSDGKIQTVVPGNGCSGYISISSNYGVTWTSLNSGYYEQWSSVAMSSDGKIQMAGVSNNDYIYISSDYGATWTQSSSPAENWYSVAMSSDGKIQAAAPWNASSYIYISNANSYINSSVGIGTTSPATQLDVYDSGTIDPFNVSSFSNLSLFRITSAGNVGIGTTTPWKALSVNGGVALPALSNGSTGYYACVNTTTGELSTSTTACGASSIKYKENVVPMTYGLNEVLNLNPVFFNYKSSYVSDQRRQVGFIAEEVASVTPEIVAYDSNGEIQGLDYPKFTAILVKAIQELNAKLDLLATTIGQGTNALKNLVVDSLTSTTVYTREINADKINAGDINIAGKICVDDVCVTKDQFKELLLRSGGTIQTTSGGSTSGSGNTGTTDTSTSTSSDTSTSTTTSTDITSTSTSETASTTDSTTE